MAFSPPEYCRLFAQKKAYQRGVTGTPGLPLATPLGGQSDHARENVLELLKLGLISG